MMEYHIVTSSLNTNGKQRSITHPQPAWRAPTMAHEAANINTTGPNDRESLIHTLLLLQGESNHEQERKDRSHDCYGELLFSINVKGGEICQYNSLTK